MVDKPHVEGLGEDGDGVDAVLPSLLQHCGGILQLNLTATVICLVNAENEGCDHGGLEHHRGKLHLDQVILDPLDILYRVVEVILNNFQLELFSV